MTSPPSFPLGCEPQRRCTFSIHCKRSLKPTLTHQFEVTWPWPVLQRETAPRVVSTAGTPQDVLGSATTLEGSVLKGGQGEDKEEIEKGNEEATKDEVPDAPDYISASPLWRDRRRYGRPTLILDLSGDPFLGGHETRRVSLLLSPGHRFLWPLIELGEPEQLPDSAGAAFWRTAFKPPTRGAQALPLSSSQRTAHPPPYCAELVVGEVLGIEGAVRQRREMAIGPSRRSTQAFRKPSFLSRISLGPGAARGAGEGVGGCGGGSLATHSRTLVPQCAKRKEEAAHGAPLGSAAEHGHGQAAAPSTSPAPSSRSLRGSCLTPKKVLTFFFYSIPFRVRWLSQIPGRIVVSLPCEERLLTLHAPHGKDQHSGAAQPRASLALDGDSTPSTTLSPMSQVHSYAMPRGVVPLDIAEIFDRPFLAIGTAEHGVLLCHLDMSTGAVEGIARWISLRGYGSALYPVMRLAAVFPALHSARARNRSTDSSSPPPPWARLTATLESLNDGVLVCSSLYEPTAAVIKLGVAAEGVVEDFAVLRGIDTILDVSATVQPDLGPLVCTISRKLLRLRVVNSSAEESERRTAILKKRTDAGLTDRVDPCLTHDRMVRLESPILHVASSPAVLQSFAEKYVSRRSYTKHWQVVVDSLNRVVLLDRTVSQYIPHSTFKLCRRGTPVVREEGGAPGRAPPTESLTAERPKESRTDSPRASKREGVAGKGDVSLADEDCDAMALSQHLSASAAAAAAVGGGKKRPRSAPKVAKKKTTAPAVKCRAAKAAPSAAVAKAEGSVGEEEEEEAGDTDSKKDDSTPGKGNSCYSMSSAIPIEDACNGLVVTSARDQLIQVAAAHDRDCISIVTWRIEVAAPPPAASPPTNTITEAFAARRQGRCAPVETV
ncbi:hypothetical protein JKF63_06463 [Porcisia hertigi]|uniref:Uncharacterized protein n=1 Tax=Porcisia hertigi TaxID=2761500 RepID=A0A836YGL7_9TRYP|nr:hypothetical protein JKF63_06463 [Porcisia hertigi]